ncbi:4-hydroxythreonine-4-phosphate dehydrogenase PdxA [Pseudooceanicola nitratireducens]|jgi:4-hydroxythreonine-4-phosphate dehydrogenase|uniref:4-hydroxythreonine-4-phosphate dehydrogenase n=1 Tax=Pseudooceanicola nitratireducens TaxID=517719 RepID=A0A1I1L8M5_9RHOB|nr:4-hydroxythreonine-4-phosphate dehydrogenase PdxA [Pseudooceanicola nitratireducens]MEC9102910.1 4-hydroxythreonine-4-phosphate dehydrogenase PdxA [Pseudomonadota bacterium]SEJ60443.1 4-hydroxythreonine-4-phosphate dehydrogenase [Pseudooceanicola nitratireducens]SFC69359.1 4-hydroxythreonine-4-phosphate dehydrogenase [Pseudooceanicola nitratireducens]
MTVEPTRPPLAVTLGDPAGIGPEIALRAVTRPDAPHCLLIGPPAAAARARDLVSPKTQLRAVDAPEHCVRTPGTIDIITSSRSKVHPYGQISAEAGQLAHEAVMTAVALAKAGRVSGIVTAPIHKEALSKAGVPFPGHTEMLEKYSGVLETGGRVAMMLANEELRVVLVTIHVSLREAVEQADYAAQLRAIRLAHKGCQAFGIGSPRIAVAGLNPHAGEGGLFGREEIDIIRPAIEAAQADGMNVSGPWPGDTVFMQARQGKFDVVVAQYHDQGLIPIKYMGLDKGVNVTLGLPFVRTSPDHGTAFDIAGKGVADASSMIAAITMADRMSRARRG